MFEKPLPGALTMISDELTIPTVGATQTSKLEENNFGEAWSS